MNDQSFHSYSSATTLAGPGEAGAGPPGDAGAVGPMFVEPLLSPLCSLIVGLRDDGEPGPLTYPAFAALHPLNLIALSMMAIVGLFTQNFMFVAAVLGAEALAVSAMPRLAPYRRKVDELIDEIKAAQAQREREAMLALMSEVHRGELQRLEAMIERTRSAAQRSPEPEAALVERRFDLDALAAAYARLAVAHRARSELQRTTSQASLDAEISQLEAQLARPQVPPRIAALIERRLEVVQRRAAHWRRTQETQMAIAQQMATIAHVVRLLHARAISPAGAEATSSELVELLDELGLDDSGA